ncbi:hypothetical protein NVIE_016980 [Nitrososphaera viennensis EN76]|uniref:DUF559 domain-containing protein n=1 Tax=Nitrososphaera viennensis EN76 TaxID=926571 RepID=A0A060HH97_9ARCH|nr:hypothetical protein NVIE_016980 [Nitrososphaera viennensis EN76]
MNLVIIVISALAIKKGLSRRRKQQRHFHSSLQTHRPSDFRRTYTTINGETVKSMGEKLLADYFYQNDIRYQYERTAWTTDNKLKHRRMISKPDFYLPDYDLYVEYWGMVDTEDESNRADYIKSMKWKMARYDENKIKFISIYPKDLDDLDRIVRAKMSESARTGRDRRDRFS